MKSRSNLMEKLKPSLAEELKENFKNCIDLANRSVGDKALVEFDIFYFNNLVNTELIDENILKPICSNLEDFKNFDDLDEFIKNGLVYHTDIKRETAKDKIMEALYDGAFIIVCKDFAYIFDTKKFEKRSIGDASTEASVKNAKDAFIEIANTNLSIVRRRIKSNNRYK